MAESTQDLPTDDLRPRTSQAPDVLTLLVGLASLVMATLAIVGYAPELPGFDPRWLLAGGAALVGVLVLVSSLRRPRDQGEAP